MTDPEIIRLMIDLAEENVHKPMDYIFRLIPREIKRRKDEAEIMRLYGKRCRK